MTLRPTPRPAPSPTSHPGGPLLVGVDLGSQSAKVVVHTPDGTVVGTGRQALRAPDTTVPGRVEHPGDDLWEATAAACRAAVADVRAHGHDPRSVVGIGLCGVRFCRALLDADGALTAPVMSWMDDRVSRPHDPQRPAATVCASSGYLTVRLTGVRRDAAGAYRGQWPVDLALWDWDRDDAVVAAYGLRREQLPELRAPGEVLGRLTGEAAAATGLPAGTPVVATSNDKAVETLGAGLRGPTDALLSFGTYVAAMVVADRQHPEAVASWTNFAAEPGRFLHESHGVRRGMWTVSWLRDLVGPSLPGDGPLEERLDAAAARVAPGADGLVTVPDWLAPTDEPWRRGAVVGLDARHGAGHLFRSLVEGLAVRVSDHLAAATAELGRTPERLLVTGGGARSAVLRQAVADANQLPVHVAAAGADSPAALGAAVCAAVGTGVHPGFDRAVEAMVPATTVTRPDPAAGAAYAALAEALRVLPDALAPALRAVQAGGTPQTP